MTLYSYVFRETEKGTFVPRISAHLLQCEYQARVRQNRGSVSPIWNIVHPAALLWSKSGMKHSDLDWLHCAGG